MRLLFDVHCQGQYLANRVEIEKENELVCVGHHPELPQNIEDYAIADFAQKNGFMVVTKDVDFVILCKERKVPVGVLRGNQLFTIENTIQLFGEKPAKRLFMSD